MPVHASKEREVSCNINNHPTPTYTMVLPSVPADADSISVAPGRCPLEGLDVNCHAKKKAKTSDPTSMVPVNNDPLQMYTFSIDRSPLRVQVLSSNTLGDLLDQAFKIVYPGYDFSGRRCRTKFVWTAAVGDFWYEFYKLKELFSLHITQTIQSPAFSERTTELVNIAKTLKNLKENRLSLLGRKSPVQEDLRPFYHLLILEDQQDVAQENAVSQTLLLKDYPRFLPNQPPPAVTFKLNATPNQVALDEHYPNLSNWCFNTKKNVEINLFQVGRKPIYAYLQRRGFPDRIGNKMILMPDNPEPTISNYLLCLDTACEYEPPTNHISVRYTWWSSIVVFPSGDHAKCEKFRAQGVDMIRRFAFYGGFLLLDESFKSQPCELNTIFPNIAALAGFRNDEKIKRGWIRYGDGVLMVCQGTGSVIRRSKKAEMGTAFMGEGSYAPSGRDKILFQFKVKVKTLFELFCHVEGLLGAC